MQSVGKFTRLILISGILTGALAGCGSPESRMAEQLAQAEAAAQRAEDAAKRAEAIAKANAPTATFANDEEPEMPAVEDQLPDPPPPPADDEQQ